MSSLGRPSLAARHERHRQRQRESGPSKSKALEAIQAGVEEDASCTLPLDVLSQLKVQLSTRAMCVPKGAAKARACADELVAAGVTRAMPEPYMLAWPDEVANVSLSDVPAYERRARNLSYAMCIAMSGDMRVGRFPCADVQASKVLRVTASDPTHAEVSYEREVKTKDSLEAIEAACSGITRPPGVGLASFTKGEAGWVLATVDGTSAGDGGSGAN